MNYSVILPLDKDYEFKLGLKEIITLEKKGIDFNILSPAILIEVVTVGLQRSIKGVTIDQVIDLIDESPLSIEELTIKVKEAFDLGLGKGKKEEIIEGE